VFPAAIAGDWVQLRALGWPLVPVYVFPDETDRGIIEFFLTLEPAGVPTSGVVLTLIAVVVWVIDGQPGLGLLRDRSLSSVTDRFRG